MKENYTFSQRIVLLVASFLGPIFIRFLGITWKVRWNGVSNLEQARKSGGPVLFCFWHSRLLGLLYTHRFRNIGIMVSKSFDGEWITRIVTRLGYRVFRGSASRDGAAALLAMIKGSGNDLALTVDGPRGPAEKAKPGIVALASHSRLPLIPISYIPSGYWRLKSWDKFIIPKPFATITVKYGPEISFKSKDAEAALLDIEDSINRISELC